MKTTSFNHRLSFVQIQFRFSRILISALLLAFFVTVGQAGSATWNLSPSNDDWNNPANWTPATVPDGPDNTATFEVSDQTDVFIDSDPIEVNGMIFNADASEFTTFVETNNGADVSLTISGVGITNNSAFAQEFWVGSSGTPAKAEIRFTNSATAGKLTIFNAVNFGGGGGIISFEGDSSGGTATVAVFNSGTSHDVTNGMLDISRHNAPGVTLGSIFGDGTVFLGARTLTVGNGNLDTLFFGEIRDGGAGGGKGGSLTKVGTGRMTLMHAITYSGATIIEGGTLLLSNRRPSPKGSGVVRVNSGTLGGTGLIAGDVFVGTGRGSGAFLSPGVFADSHRTLRLLRTLTFNSGGTYNFGMNSNAGGADKVIANGVTINNGAEFSFEDSHSSALPPDTVFTVIDNTAATPIAGAFSNLVDGSTFTVGSNTFQVNYEGGDGNDLTLTVL